MVRVDERLFSLILALIASRHGLTKDHILSTVYGYAPGYLSGASVAASQANASLDRMFERDKDAVRELGVVIETLTQLDDIDDNKIVRYRISEDAYELPESVRFSPQEMSLLHLAASAWREGSLSATSRHALTKLISLGVAADSPLIGVEPRIRVDDRAFEKLREILDARGVARFSYIKPGATQATERSAAPLGLTSWQGNWYVLAFDMDAQAERTFLLSRIVSDVKKVPNTVHEREHDFFASRLHEELEDRASRTRAVVDILPGTDAALRFRSRVVAGEKPGPASIPFADIDLLADELVGYGNDVRVIAPPELVQKVIARLTTVIALHDVSSRPATSGGI